MMFADLIDEEDFRERLHALGAQLPSDASPQLCVRLALQQNIEGLSALADQLLVEAGLLQPEVKAALEELIAG